jgi:hypothetical protein
MNDPVSHPSHYTSSESGVECIEITQHQAFCVGNAVKYVWRAGEKDKAKHVEDLQKAIWYLDRQIETHRYALSTYPKSWYANMCKVVLSLEPFSNIEEFFMAIYSQDLPAAIEAIELEIVRLKNE